MKILIAEDDPVTARLVEAILRKAAHMVTIAGTGIEALARLKEAPFDVLVTDWMMPGMDGIELIRRVRAEIAPSPAILMATAIGLPDARQHALYSGADGFLTKPVSGVDLLALLRQTQARVDQTPRVARIASRTPRMRLPPFVAVAIATSTGGPDALRTFFQLVTPAPGVAYFAVVHGPAWMQHTCAEILQRDAPALTFVVATDGMIARPNTVYLAPGDKHLVVKAETFTLELTDDPLVNFVRPAADPLFQSVAAAFGRYSIGSVLTGLGCDGAEGLAAISAAGGKVFVQDPATAVAASMPKAALHAVGSSTVLSLDRLASAMVHSARDLVAALHAATSS